MGAVFISQGILNFQNLLTAMFGVMFAAMGMGNSQGMAVDGKKAAMATATLFGLMDRKPKIPALPPSDSAAASGGAAALSIKGVTLQYRGRGGAPPALNDLNLDIPAGAFVALVGASGCGKSSVVSLLLRLYEPSSGSVTLNGVDIRALPLDKLRSQIAWVQQEPSLFNSVSCFFFAVCVGGKGLLLLSCPLTPLRPPLSNAPTLSPPPPFLTEHWVQHWLPQPPAAWHACRGGSVPRRLGAHPRRGAQERRA